MTPSQIYIAVSIGALAIIDLFLFVVKKEKKEKQLTPLAGLAFGCILTGLFFGGDRILGYSLIGAGLIFAGIDIIKKLKKD